MFKRLMCTSLIFGMAAVAPPAAQAATCATRDSVVKSLQSKYSEALTAGGLQMAAGAQTVMEIWSSADTGTYTVLLTNANGISCIVAAGTDFFKAVPIAVVSEGTAS